MSELLERTMRDDRLVRDAARAVVDADIAHLRADLASRSIPTRIKDRISEGAADVLDEAVAVAEDNKGVIATLVGAIVLWFARHPLLDLVSNNESAAERPNAGDR
ncbi:hypothetical protein GCM10011515_10120 [Tsuneonella deserti]|uniref:DUF3618 domain-containing protein n=1 Tax=Tsuneonella deserti TaxID=2035528 RepID=A0ABQ1S3M2_9SPHN|nr:hypothetical protein [Tsuneonella deserti]GGD92376.1 hypothetical protein GCM10011515_10120 [Tsuneonella deserti]